MNIRHAAIAQFQSISVKYFAQRMVGGKAFGDRAQECVADVCIVTLEL